MALVDNTEDKDDGADEEQEIFTLEDALREGGVAEGDKGSPMPFSSQQRSNTQTSMAVVGGRPVTLQIHSFSRYTFTRPSWCDLCGEFIWGLVKQGIPIFVATLWFSLAANTSHIILVHDYFSSSRMLHLCLLDDEVNLRVLVSAFD